MPLEKEEKGFEIIIPVIEQENEKWESDSSSDGKIEFESVEEALGFRMKLRKELKTRNE